LPEFVERNVPITAITEATAQKSDFIGKKHVVIEAQKGNSADIKIGLSYEYSGQGRLSTQYDTLKAGQIKFYSAPKGKSIYYLWFYADAATQLMNIIASDGSIAYFPQVFQAWRQNQAIAVTAGNVQTNLTVPTGKRWKLLYGILTLTTDATVANRFIQVELRDSAGNILTRFPINSAAITDSQTGSIDYLPVAGGANIGTRGNATIYILAESCILDEGDKLNINIGGGVAGDSYSGYMVVLEEDKHV
jgi:hypothetical protein